MREELSGFAQQPPKMLSTELLHDLRTPLNQIIGYSELLVEQAKDEGQGNYIPDLEKIHNAGRHLLALLNSGRPINETSVPGTDCLVSERDTDSTQQIQLKTELHITSRISILVVDDNEMNRDMLSRRLLREGYFVETAESGTSAVEMVRGHSFDLILLDIMMPEMDGYAVLQLLKSDVLLSHIPVIMISAVDELDSVVRCIELGADDYLCKPIEPTLLKARMRSSLEKKFARDREIDLYDQLQINFQKLQDLEKMRDDLKNMIIHDLRTPLTSLITGMQTLQQMGDIDDMQLEVVNISITGGETLLGMINDLLDVDKMEDGSMNLDYDQLDAAKLVASAVEQVDSLSKNESLRIETHLSHDLPLFPGDETKLRRVLVNLLGNAIKFTPSGGTLTLDVHLTQTNNSVEFSITDTGEGIPPEAFDRIFEKFGQVESRKAGRKMSTGLGLTFCKLAVEAHGGHIDVKSEPGIGSTFYFTVPLSPAA